MEGQIIKIISNDYTVSTKKEQIVCKSRGKFRNDNITPVVGDYVIFDKDKKYILEILPRKNILDRPSVSNIDQAFVITSLKHPDFSTNLLDKFLVVLEAKKIKPIICLTKKDLLTKNELKELKPIINYYKKIGYTVIYNSELRKIKKLFKNKTTVFTGQTGSGKSTLLNKLDKTLSLETNEISEALGRGKHTTRFTQLLEIFSGKVLDTPGFSDIDIKSIDNIKNYFIEFKKYPCRYQDCNHNKEKECKIKLAVANKKILKSRYENYIKFIERG